MKITSNSLKDGIFIDDCGKYSSHKRADGRVTFSPHLKIEEAPEETKSFALFMEDRDAIPVCGFSWIHWVACNIETQELVADASQHAADSYVRGESEPFTQGANSWISPLAGSMDRIAASTFGGMAPPDKDHRYEFYVFALDTRLDLQQGFYANELFSAMDGHILTVGSLSGIYPAQK